MSRANGAPRPTRRRRRPPPTVEGITWLASEAEETTQWPWPGYLPGGAVVVLEGRKGTGKSTVAAAIAGAFTGGPRPPGWDSQDRLPVLWSAGEESYTTIVQPRLRAAGADVGLVGRPEVVQPTGPRRRIQLPSDCQTLCAQLSDSGARFLVLDPFWGAVDQGLDLGRPQQARLYGEAVAEVCAQTGCSALLTRNLRKGVAGDAREQGLGSVEIGNVARLILRTDEHPHEPNTHTLSVVVSNYGPRAPTLSFRVAPRRSGGARIEWLGVCPLSADQLAEGRAGAAERDEYSDAERIIAALIGSGSIPYTALRAEAEDAGVSLATLRRVKATLSIPSIRVSSGGRAHWEWRAPKGGWPQGLIARG